MKRQSIFFALLFVFFVSSVRLPAQETRQDVAHPSAADTKPNSDQVPDGYAIDTHFTRVVVLRFKYDTDLLAGLKKMVEQEKIKNAVPRRNRFCAELSGPSGGKPEFSAEGHFREEPNRAR